MMFKHRKLLELDKFDLKDCLQNIEIIFYHIVFIKCTIEVINMKKQI